MVGTCVLGKRELSSPTPRPLGNTGVTGPASTLGICCKARWTDKEAVVFMTRGKWQ